MLLEICKESAPADLEIPQGLAVGLDEIPDSPAILSRTL